MPAPFQDLGPCSVTWDLATLNVALNPTFGGVRFRDTLLHVGIKEDGQGETDVDAVDTGRTVGVEVPMTRFSLAQLNQVIGGSTLNGTKLDVANSVGNPLLALSKEILIKPMIDNVPTPTTTKWVHFHRCYPLIDLDIVFDNSEQRVAKVLFKVFPDDLSGNVGKMYRFGPA